MYRGLATRKTGVHDVRGYGYQHPWLAVCRKSGEVVGCWSRRDARTVLKQIVAEADAREQWAARHGVTL